MGAYLHQIKYTLHVCLLLLMLLVPDFFALEPLGRIFSQNSFNVVFIFCSGLILLLAMVIFTQPRLFFLCMSPFALLALPYAYAIVLFDSIPGRSFIQVTLGTTIRELHGLIIYLNWYLLVPIGYFLIYIFLVMKLDKHIRIKKQYRRSVVLLSLIVLLTGILGKQFWDKDVKLDGVINASLVVDSYPLGLLINLVQHAAHGRSEVIKYSRLNTQIKDKYEGKETVVLVIGESVRGDHLSLNGYSRKTTPKLNVLQSNLVSFSNVSSYANSTHQSVPRLMTFPNGEKGSYSLVQTFQEAGYNTAWISNQISEIYRPNANYEEFSESTWADLFRKDEDMLPTIQGVINQHGNKQFIVVHMLGSHMDYDARYTLSDSIFFPRYSDVNSTINSDVSRTALVNSYDNSIVAMDSFLSRLIGILEEYGGRSTLIFTSDHGENLFDDSRNLFMHSSPVPSRYEVEVPLIIWCGAACLRTSPDLLTMLDSNKHEKVSHRNIFFSILDIAGFQVLPEHKSLSLLGNTFVTEPRWVYPVPSQKLRVSELD